MVALAPVVSLSVSTRRHLHTAHPTFRGGFVVAARLSGLKAQKSDHEGGSKRSLRHHMHFLHAPSSFTRGICMCHVGILVLAHAHVRIYTYPRAQVSMHMHMNASIVCFGRTLSCVKN